MSKRLKRKDPVCQQEVFRKTGKHLIPLCCWSWQRPLSGALEGCSLNGPGSPVSSFLSASLLYALLLLFFVLATKSTTAANAIFLQYTAPVYVLVLEPLLYKERFRQRDLITVVACVVGMSLFFVGKLRPQDYYGNLLALASGLCFAFYFLLLRHTRSREVNRASSVIYGNLLVVLIAAPAGLAALPGLTRPDALTVLYLGVIQIGVAYTFFTLGMARGIRSLDAGIVGFVEPMLNPIWVFLFLGERPSSWAVLGGLIIILAVVWHMLLAARVNARLPVKVASI